MDRLKEETSRLKELGRLRPTPERWALVREGLSSKFEGVQSVALQVLAGWGGRDAARAIREFLTAAFEREYGWSIRKAAVKALAQIVGPDDAGWVLDLYLSRPGVLDKHELLPLVLALPVAEARERLVSELRSSDPLNRQAAAKAIGNMAFADRSALLKPLLTDENAEVRESARLLTAR